MIANIFKSISTYLSIIKSNIEKMKAIKLSLALLALLSARSAYAQAATEDILLEEEELQQTKPEVVQAPVSPFRLKGSYNPQVHILSQLASDEGLHPSVRASAIFPETFGSQ